MDTIITFSFTDLPGDLQIRVLSFLKPSEIANLALTSKRLFSLCCQGWRLLVSMCDRRWGQQTLINRWGNGKISYKKLYRKLDEYDNLIGFWSSQGSPRPCIVAFEWRPFYITCSKILPEKNGGYGVVRKTFMWMTLNSQGDALNYLDPDGDFALTEKDLLQEDSEKLRDKLILVNVGVMGKCYLRLSPNQVFYEKMEASSGPIRIYRQRMMMIRKWKGEYYEKIVSCSPIRIRPLEGFWKGICDDGNLNFYRVSYYDRGEIICTKVGGSFSEHCYEPGVFFCRNTTPIEPPFSLEEDDLYNCRTHSQPPTHDDEAAIIGMLYMNSKDHWDGNPVNADGRVWMYRNGTFGFGFLRDNHVVDLKPMTRNGHLLDVVEAAKR